MRDGNNFADKVIGLSVKSFSAFGDLETPSKKIIFNMSFDKGYSWAKENKDIDFYFPNRAIVEAINFAKKSSEDNHKGERNPSIEQTQVFGFLFGVFDFINSEK